MAGGRGARRRGPARSRSGRLRARRVGRAARRVLSRHLRYQRLRIRLAKADLAVYRSIRRLARGEGPAEGVDAIKLYGATRWIRRYSALGEHGIAWFALGTAGALVDRRRREEWLRATAGVGCCYLFSSSIKWAIGRERPAVEDLPKLMRTPTGLSFPSSHATSSFAAARAYGRLVPRGPLLTAATAMGLSRIYLGVHYPSDVLAGATLGTVLGGMAK